MLVMTRKLQKSVRTGRVGIWQGMLCDERDDPSTCLLVRRMGLAWKRQGLRRTGRPMWHTAYVLKQIGAHAQRTCQWLDPGSQAQAHGCWATYPPWVAGMARL